MVLTVSRDLTRNDHFLFRINGFEKSWPTIRKNLLAKMLESNIRWSFEFFASRSSTRKNLFEKFERICTFPFF